MIKDEVKKAVGTTPFKMSLVGKDAKAVIKAVNQGIDSYLEACYVPDRGDSYTTNGNRLECKVSGESMPTLLRRLKKAGARALVRDILSTLGLRDE